ncbi:hypothetical protein AB870_03485 [Pandoraea faecigallinarum]|uniref:Uncharacterized protein n=1 Tax=Pandoraea faecigallinarum TaxID=656179 RepID=A0A173GZZ3_9BURK|nr:hypothetical protein [Pandoraea faecigallinarum]ANI21759.1 hypothetical protein AB870_03485 [Pandoraea faecigallinarum]
MTTTEKILGCLLIVAAAVAGVCEYGYRRAAADAVQQRSRADQLDATLKATQRADRAKQARLDRLAAEEAKNKEKLKNALDANRAWADAPVPDAVFDSLFGDAADTTNRPAR